MYDTTYQFGTVPLEALLTPFPNFAGHMKSILASSRGETCVNVCLTANREAKKWVVTHTHTIASLDTTSTLPCDIVLGGEDEREEDEDTSQGHAEKFAEALMDVMDQWPRVHRNEFGPFCIPVQVVVVYGHGHGGVDSDSDTDSDSDSDEVSARAEEGEAKDCGAEHDAAGGTRTIPL